MSMDYCFQCDAHIDTDYSLDHEGCDMQAKKLQDIKSEINTSELAETLIYAGVVIVLTYYSLILITN